MVWADSHGISRAPWYLGLQTIKHFWFFVYRTLTLCGCSSQNIQLNQLPNLKTVLFRHLYPTSLMLQHAQVYTTQVLSFSRFAHHYLGNHIRFLFLVLLRCFSSHRSLSYPIYSDKNAWSSTRRVSPFGNLRINARLTAPRSLQQSSTSFIASWYQGIHQMPFSIIYKLSYRTNCL